MCGPPPDYTNEVRMIWKNVAEAMHLDKKISEDIGGPISDNHSVEGFVQNLCIWKDRAETMLRRYRENKCIECGLKLPERFEDKKPDEPDLVWEVAYKEYHICSDCYNNDEYDFLETDRPAQLKEDQV
jgi:hypothetical protein